MRASLLLALTLLSLSSCSCDPPPDVPPGVEAVGSVRVDVVGNAATIVLVGLEQPLRAFEVDVRISNGRATAITPIADHDVVEAGLLGGPQERFTVVVADTRRLPLRNGALAVLGIDEGAAVTLSAAAGVDQQGNKRALRVVAR